MKDSFAKTQFPKRVYLRELGAREGFQTLAEVVGTARKVELIEALAQTGVPEIEVTSFVRPDRVPQMADAEQVVVAVKELAPKYPATKFTALYLNSKGFERAQSSPGLRNDAWIYTAASAEFLKRNNNQTHQQVLDQIPVWIDTFKRAGMPMHGVMISTVFGCNFQGRIENDIVLEHLDKIIDRLGASARPREISLADTMGWGSPERVQQLVHAVRAAFSDVRVSLHLHDTRGAGMANVYAGLLAGVDLFDCSVGGLGGCPFAKNAAGNVATEDVAYLCGELGIETGVSLDLYRQAAQLAEKIIGASLPGRYYRS